ncbi:DNA mismatch repair protein [Arachnomyces sp. PD_36]|nr:DNA mismatch repair protein [Arachnomyces sp. PD_36]
MSSQTAPIRPLPPDVVAQIKSSISITHIRDVVLELLKNALDADAQNISVGVNFERGGCVVEDDGHGIPPVEFKAGGGLGKTHHTSKLDSRQEVYGHRGMFLTSLASLSLLTITSRHELDTTTNTVTFHHSRPITRLTPAPSQHRLESRTHGTRVTVHDLFGNMPVRVKHRALTFSSTDDLDREWENLKVMLASLLLAVGKAVKLVVSSSDKSRKITLRCPPELARKGDDRAKSQSVLDLERVQKILTQAGYITPSGPESWVTVSARTPALSIAAAISTEPSPTKQVQFISFGIHPKLPQNNANVLYDEINRIFASSTFGNVEDSLETVGGGTSSSSQAEKQQQENGAKKRKFRGGGKGVNKWPMFYVRINARDPGPSQTLDGDATLESDKSLQIVLDVLGTMIHSFLEQHHFRPRARKRVRWSKTASKSPNPARGESGGADRTQHKLSSFMDIRPSSEPPTSTESFLGGRTKLPTFQPTTNDHPKREFGNWSRIKSGSKNSFEDICSGLPRGKESSLGGGSSKGSRVVDIGKSKGEHGLRNHLDTSTIVRLSQSPSVNNSEAGMDNNGQKSLDGTDTAISWTDPLTKTAVLINSRTGLVMPPEATPTGRPEIRQRHCSTGSLYRCSRSVSGKSVGNLESNSWIEDVIRKWENPIFPHSEKPIPSVSIDASDILPSDLKFGDIKFPPSAKYKGKLTKSGLEQAQVIAQVDHKFILIKILATPEDTDDSEGQEEVLALVDQHAADERCRIEQLFEDLCPRPTGRSLDEPGSRTEVQATVLSKPLRFDVSLQEGRLFESYTEYFSSWGCVYEMSTSTQQTRSVAVTRLPTLISERCRLEPKLAIEMLRGEIWAREEGSRKPIKPSSSAHDSGGDVLGNERASQGTTKGGHNTTSWLERITHCPQGIIDMLNSRSCRSAIMFNDILSLQECQKLVSKLSRCAFPFQCAHGRPSMVPIVNLGSCGMASDSVGDGKLGVSDVGQSSQHEEDHQDRSLDFAQAFRNWQGV